MSFGFGFALPAIRTSAGGNNPFNQLGPTLDLTFAGVPTDLSDPNGYSLSTDFIVPQYQIAAQYSIWENDVGLVSKTFSQIITFTRASTATYFDATGTLQSAAINTPRFDYDPATLAARGFLIEEARTNSIRNNTMQGAVAGTPGTLPTNWQINSGTVAVNVIGTGIENGITYIDLQFVGTPSQNFANVRFETNTQIAAVNGQTWSSSFYVRQIAGATTNITSVDNRIIFRDSGGSPIQEAGGLVTSLFSNPNLSVSGSSFPLTAANASVAYVSSAVYFILTVGAAIDITLRIGLPQLELGAFATSVIPTTTTALTRSADVALVNTLSPWFNATSGTLYAEFTRGYTGNFSNFAGPAIITNNLSGASGNSISSVSQNSANQQLFNSMVVSGVEQLAYAFENASVNNKVALAYETNNTQQFINGVAKTTDTVCTVPTSLTRLNLGANNNGTTYVNSWLRRVTYYPRRISQAEGIAITA